MVTGIDREKEDDMPLELTIVTPEGETYSGTIDQVVLPGAEGDFGVLQQHERFLAPLRHGALQIIGSGSTQFAAVSDGIADVSSEQVVVLADYCALASEIDTAAVESAKAEVQAKLDLLSGSHEDDIPRADLESEMTRLDVWLDVSAR